MKFLIFGTGEYYKRYKGWFLREEIAGLLDNAPDKQGITIDGMQVLAPEEGLKLQYDFIVILSFYVKEMKQQLLNFGVPEDKIYHFFDLHKLIGNSRMTRKVMCYGDAEKYMALKSRGNGAILLLSQDMTLGGPAIALFHAAESLKRMGYQIVYASMMDGPLRPQILSAGIPVIVDENLQIGTMTDCRWTALFSLIFCNTVNFHVFLSDRKVSIPVIWWLHDSSFFYDGVDCSLLQKINRTNLHVVSVGFVPETAIRYFLPDLPVGRLLYGVTDTLKGKRELLECGSCVLFVTIGYIERRKGQDILLEAVERLSEGVCKKAAFYFVGGDSSGMAGQIRQKIQGRAEVIMTGVVDREAVESILSKADVLICPSREDPMPTVAAEAMMHGVPCILSDAAGTAEYITDGVDGLIFASENAQELAQKIEWCISHENRVKEMGKQARKIYEKLFSMDVFEKSLSELMENISRQQIKGN